MIPLVILYILSIFLASIGQKQFERSMALQMEEQEQVELDVELTEGDTEEE